MIYACHQPNFFPWIGFFHKLYLSDTFIILDDVQFEKSSSGTWSNRVKLKINKKPQWITAPIERQFNGYKKINEIMFSKNYDWRLKLLKSIEHNYKKAPFYNEVIKIFEPLIFFDNDNLLAYNMNCITSLALELKMFDKIIKLSSSLNHIGKSNELLVSIGNLIGASSYLSGQGSRGYINEEMFIKGSLKLLWQNIDFDQYQQGDKSEFLPGLSIIDALMFIGKERTIKIIKQNSYKSS